MTFGYVRHSLNNPASIQRQRIELEACGVDCIIIEESGQPLGPQFQTLLNKLNPGDDLVVVSLDRIIGENAKLLRIVDHFIENNITLCEKGTDVDLPGLRKKLY